jgi:hypothetical protein
VQAPLGDSAASVLATVFTPNKGHMNRRSIVIASALFLSVGATRVLAQDVIPKPSFGLLAGANFAKLSGSDISNASNRTGFVGGVSVNFHLASHFHIEIDGLYSQEGAKFTADGADDETFKLDYIRVPVLLRYNFPTHTSVRPFLTAGPSFGFKVGCKETQGGNSQDCSDVEGPDVKSFDFAATAGAGVAFRLGKEEVSVTGRYMKGFSKIISDSDVKNENFSLMAGFAF